MIMNNENKFYISLFVNYFKDYWMNHNHMIAFDNFKKSLEGLNGWRSNLINSNINEDLKVSDRQKNVTCVISGIVEPDNIFISSLQFQKMMEI